MVICPTWFIAGATASGKSALSIALARRMAELGGPSIEVVNLDSVQVFDGAVVGSAAPPAALRGEVPHHLVGIRSPSERWNAGDFSAAARETCADIIQKGSVPVVVGGGGMHATAFIHGLADLPRSSPMERAELLRLDHAEIRRRLALLDPASARRIHPNDLHRLIRALEVALGASAGLDAAHEAHRYQSVKVAAEMVVLWWSRPELRERVGMRTRRMLTDGLIEETRRLCERCGIDAPLFESIGYRQACAVLRGELEAEHLEEDIITATMQLAKRQTTYWRNEPRKRQWEVVSFCESATIDSRFAPVPVLRLSLDALCGELNRSLKAPRRVPRVWHVAGDCFDEPSRTMMGAS